MKLVILSRDGVINEVCEGAVRRPGQWQAMPGSLDAIARLNRAGFRVVVATNQPGVAHGLLDLDTLHAIHRKMISALDTAGGILDGIYFCPHGEDAGCQCRKPAPGLFHEIARRTHADLEQVISIGNSLNDLEATLAAGANPVLVRTGIGRTTEATLPPGNPIPVYDNLAQAADALLEYARSRENES